MAVSTDAATIDAKLSGDFDLELFERLNEEYRDKPILPAPPARDSPAGRHSARRRVRELSRWVELQGARVVEIGCGRGYFTRRVVRAGGAGQALGIDVVEGEDWKQLSGPKISFLAGDLASDELVEPGSVDVVASYSVLEHVRRPVRMLEAIERALRPGGRAFLRFNLHRGPLASHSYHQVFFGWPHLLFEPDVCAAYLRKHHDMDSTFAWVNELTAAQYLDLSREVGLRIEHLKLQTRDWDVPLYARFIERLGRYPALDLETDFMALVLEKPRPGRLRRAGASQTLEPLGYLERQRELDARVAALRNGGGGTGEPGLEPG